MLRAMGTAWVVREAVPGPDVDEFTDPRQVRAALSAQTAGRVTLLAVQHPHRTPDSLARHRGLSQVLPDARAKLRRLQRESYRRVADVVAPYQVDGPDGSTLGLLCLADPAEVDEVQGSAVRRTEEVYPDIVAERAAVLAELGCLTSSALLVPVCGGEELTAALRTTVAGLGDPEVSIVDVLGNRHRLWLLGPGQQREELLALAGRHPLLVADGNHRVAAAEAAGLGGLLALVTAGPLLRVGPIHRVLAGTGLSLAQVAGAWRAYGLTVTEADPAEEPMPGTVLARAEGQAVRVELPPPPAGEPLPRIDHSAVEETLIAAALGLDPAGRSVLAVPGGRRPAPREPGDIELLIAPVPLADVLAVHEAGRRMPRKSTYFTPKPRSGLLLAELDGG
ncbi:DUF1015 family protein [Crossiella sp. CA-258035]|uniref:DUF1015 family protein n=1 Tax=Crossiella sp. CA-258035 TaxID=2981138 RepID=UPI0024BC0D5B|nr:DUF1015 family protein [Crossiella sp. CA-258035]WHT16756.1 DUF1015 family protein [Crossiella sp. CA-258035]